jgi:DNA invertase Pin-like site-specific DNA recombinase
MTKLGYARVSTRDQHPEVQRERLEAAGCARVYEDKVSGTLASRPAWDRCLDRLEAGDTLVCVRLDRIGRSVRNLIEVIELLASRKVDLIVLDQGLDTTTPAGRMMFHVLAAIAEFEHDLISERTKDGLAATRARGRSGGPKFRLNPRQVKVASAMYEERGEDGHRAYTVAQIASDLHVTRATIYRALKRAQGGTP